jgi:hypothetical protein
VVPAREPMTPTTAALVAEAHRLAQRPDAERRTRAGRRKTPAAAI